MWLPHCGWGAPSPKGESCPHPHLVSNICFENESPPESQIDAVNQFNQRRKKKNNWMTRSFVKPDKTHLPICVSAFVSKTKETEREFSLQKSSISYNVKGFSRSRWFAKCVKSLSARWWRVTAKDKPAIHRVSPTKLAARWSPFDSEWQSSVLCRPCPWCHVCLFCVDHHALLVAVLQLWTLGFKGICTFLNQSPEINGNHITSRRFTIVRVRADVEQLGFVNWRVALVAFLCFEVSCVQLPLYIPDYFPVTMSDFSQVLTLVSTSFCHTGSFRYMLRFELKVLGSRRACLLIFHFVIFHLTAMLKPHRLGSSKISVLLLRSFICTKKFPFSLQWWKSKLGAKFCFSFDGFSTHVVRGRLLQAIHNLQGKSTFCWCSEWTMNASRGSHFNLVHPECRESRLSFSFPILAKQQHWSAHRREW